MYGDEAAPYRALLDIRYPIAEGKIQNWEDFSALWEYSFKQRMGIKDLSDKKILVTEAALNPKKNREKMAEQIFEKHGFGGCMFESQAILSLMCEGHNTGIVVDSGDGVSHVIPVVDGYIQDHAIRRLNLAGRHVTNYLVRLLMQSGYAFNSSADFETVKEIKEHLCFVSYDIEKDKKLALETTLLDKEYVLPDNSIIKVGRERYQAAECLFNPSLAGVEDAGIAHKTYDSLSVCEMDHFLPLTQNIIMTGGTTMFPGLSTRMYKELAAIMTAEKYKGDASRVAKTGMTVHDPPRRKHAVFIGGSFLATGSEDKQWISKAAWQEKGARICWE
jgi:actin-related protein 2